MNGQGLTRLDKWFTPHNQVLLLQVFYIHIYKYICRFVFSFFLSKKLHLLNPLVWQHERNRIKREMSTTLLKRQRQMCNFITWREYTVVYRRCLPRP
jgi:hypothetical protein